MKAEIIIQGLVQGVGYRFFAIKQAQLYNIKGYTKNLPDGSVEVVAEGEQGMINDFIESLKIGPLSARVAGIDVKWREEDEGFTEFGLRF